MSAAVVSPHRMEGLGDAIDAISEDACEVKESELVEGSEKVGVHAGDSTPTVHAEAMATIPAGMSFPTALLRLAEESLSFAWDAGGVTPVAHPHSTGWRTLPSLVTAHVLDVHFTIELAGISLPRKPGDCLCIAEDLRHCVTLAPPDPGVSRWSHARFRILGSVDPLRTLTLPPVITGPTAIAIGDINEALVPLAQPRDLAEVARRQALGFRLMELVAGCGQPRPEGIELLRSAERLAPVLAAVESDLGHDRLDLPRLARIAGLSPSRFHAVFRAAFGVAPARWIQERRLGRARELLAGSELPIHDVAQRAGFQDPFHFSRIFKRREGLAPVAYRERSRHH